MNFRKTLSVHPLVGQLVSLLFCQSHFYLFMNFIFSPYCSCLMNFIMSRAHLHATGVDMHLALLLFSRVLRKSTPCFVHCIGRSVCQSVVHILVFYKSKSDLTVPAQMASWPQIWPLPTRTRLQRTSDVSGLVCFRYGISLSEDMVHLSFAIAM